MNPQYTDPNSCFSSRIHAFSLAIKWKVCDFFFKDIYCSGEFNHTASFHKTRSSLAGLVAVNCDDTALRAGGSRPWTVPSRQALVERRGETVLRGPDTQYYPSPSKYTITQKGEWWGGVLNSHSFHSLKLERLFRIHPGVV